MKLKPYQLKNQQNKIDSKCTKKCQIYHIFLEFAF